MSGHLVDAAGNVIGALPLRIFIDGRADPVYEITEGGLEGGLRIVAPNADYEAHRNMQGGMVDSPNVDFSAGGDGSQWQPRGVTVFQRDNGRGFDIGRGIVSRGNLFSARFAGTDPLKDLGTFSIPIRFKKGAFVPNGSGGWHKLT
jgi:hypothetical protein